MSAFNEVSDIFIDEGKRPENTNICIFYESNPYGKKKENHCLMIKAIDIKRLTLNQYSFTLIFNEGLMKFGVLKEFDTTKIAEIAKVRFNENFALKVAGHFSKLKLNNKNDE